MKPIISCKFKLYNNEIILKESNELDIYNTQMHHTSGSMTGYIFSSSRSANNVPLTLEAFQGPTSNFEGNTARFMQAPTQKSQNSVFHSPNIQLDPLRPLQLPVPPSMLAQQLNHNFMTPQSGHLDPRYVKQNQALLTQQAYGIATRSPQLESKGTSQSAHLNSASFERHAYHYQRLAEVPGSMLAHHGSLSTDEKITAPKPAASVAPLRLPQLSQLPLEKVVTVY